MRMLRGHVRPVRALAYAPHDPGTLVSGSEDGTVRLWNLGTGDNWATLDRHREGVLSLAFAPDGPLLATGGRELVLWDLSARWSEYLCYVKQPTGKTAVAFSPDGRLLAAAEAAGPVRFWTLPFQGNVAWPVASLRLSSPVRALAFAPEGRTLATAHLDRSVRLWDVTDPQRLRTSPDGPRPEAARVWNFQAEVQALAFLPARTAPAVVIAAGRSVRILDLQGRQLAACRGHTGEVTSLALSPDGRHLLTGSRDRTVKLWDVPAGRERLTFNWEVGAVRLVAIATDGLTAALAGEGPRLLVFDLEDR